VVRFQCGGDPLLVSGEKVPRAGDTPPM